MSKSQGLKKILDQAKQKEKKYDWANAAELYEQALGAVGKEDFFRRGEVRERIGYCLYRGAFQAETQEGFKNRMQGAVEAYEKAAEVYEKVDYARSSYSRARALYAKSWTLTDVSLANKVLDDCMKLLKEAMKAFEKTGDGLRWAKACNDLLFCLSDRLAQEWDWTEVNRYIEEGITHGRNAISTLSKVGDENELAQAYCTTVFFFWVGGYLGEEKKKEFFQKASRYSEKALELSKRTGDSILIACAHSHACMIELAGNLELSLGHAEEGLQHAKRTKDNFLIGWAFDGLARTMHACIERRIQTRKEKDSKVPYAIPNPLHIIILQSARAVSFLLFSCGTSKVTTIWPVKLKLIQRKDAIS